MAVPGEGVTALLVTAHLPEVLCLITPVWSKKRTWMSAGIAGKFTDPPGHSCTLLLSLLNIV